MPTDKEAFNTIFCNPDRFSSQRERGIAEIGFAAGRAMGRNEVSELLRDKDDVYGIGNMCSQWTAGDIADDIIERLGKKE